MKKIKRIICLMIAMMLTLSTSIVSYAKVISVELPSAIAPVIGTDPVNVASIRNNPDVKVTSGTHPYGGYYISNGTPYDVPLTKINDGIIKDLPQDSFYLCYKADTTVSGYHPEKAPVKSDNPIHVCIDLGKQYDLSEIVFWGRTGSSETSLSNVYVYGSNDAKSIGSDWKNAVKTEFKDVEGNTFKKNAVKIAGGKNSYKISFSENSSENSGMIVPGEKRYRYIILAADANNSWGGSIYFTELEIYGKQASQNVILPANNSKVEITSATHPEGGYYDATNDFENNGVDVPLTNINDGIIKDQPQDSFYLSYKGSATTTVPPGQGTEEHPEGSTVPTQGYDPVKAPVKNENPIHVCIDLGKPYSLNEIVFWGRTSAANTTLTNVSVYGSNDANCKTADWKNSDVTELKDINGQTFKENQVTILGKTNSENINGEYSYTMSVSDDNRYRYIVLAADANNSWGGSLYFTELEIFADIDKNGYITDYREYAAKNEKIISSVELPAGVAEECKAIAAVYDSKESLVGASIANATASNTQNIFDITMPENMDETYKVKYFLWNAEDYSPVAVSIPETQGVTLVSQGKEVKSNHYWEGAYKDVYPITGINDGKINRNGENAFLASTKVDNDGNDTNATMVDVRIDLGEPKKICTIKVRPRAGNWVKTKNMSIYGMNDLTWIPTADEGTAPELITAEMIIDAEKAGYIERIYKFADDLPTLKNSAGADIEDAETMQMSWMDENAAVIRLDGTDVYRYILCILDPADETVSPSSGVALSFGELEVYAVE